jgi:hypothetical protein
MNKEQFLEVLKTAKSNGLEPLIESTGSIRLEKREGYGETYCYNYDCPITAISRLLGSNFSGAGMYRQAAQYLKIDEFFVEQIYASADNLKTYPNFDKQLRKEMLQALDLEEIEEI